MKKIIALFLCMLMAIALCACDDGSAEKGVSDEVSIINDEDFGDEDGHPDFSVPETSGERNEDLIAALTPEGAEVITDIEGSLIMHSSMSIEDLAAFYAGAVAEIGAAETGGQFDSAFGEWIYTGAYGEGKTLVISLRDDTDFRIVIIDY